ncbi:thioredoxin [Bartonella sp. A05]|uniref:thioredoxin n=1 Tax=Bartonella sp. A05 TaxID=2967261 RepID=UPI0022A91C11|nr:thioredoxin [Bartonella sp. A05]MCZ2203494.1 thioredoxin [Bartonella sp. A05]
MTCIKIDKSNFENEVLASSIPVVVDFWAEWCGPCKMIAPILDEISVEMKNQVKIAKINIDENPELATQYGVRSIPTLLMFKNGNVASNMVGATTKGRLSEWIKDGLI